MSVHAGEPSRFSAVLGICAGVSLFVAIPSSAADVPVFVDGFESGDTTAWSVTEPPIVPPPPVTAFRISELVLRDPHVFVNFFNVSCLDLTDSTFAGFSVNQELADAIGQDNDGDGFLDLSLLLLFRPLAATASNLPVDYTSAACTAPVAGTTCSPDGSFPVAMTYDAFDVGTCLEPIPGSLRPYDPAVAVPTPPCFATFPKTVGIVLAGLVVPLVEARVAGAWIGDPPTSVFLGTLMGFLSEAVADSLVLPSSIPLVGNQPLSSVLRGGTGNCASGDDRDELYPGGENGWWLYFNFQADEVPWIE